MQKQVISINDRIDKVEDENKVITYIKNNSKSLDRYPKKNLSKNKRSTSQPKYENYESTGESFKNNNSSDNKSPRPHFLRARYNTIKTMDNTFKNKKNNLKLNQELINELDKKISKNINNKTYNSFEIKTNNAIGVRQTSPFEKRKQISK